MMEDIYLPRKLGDKLKRRFLKSTYKKGEYIEFEVFAVNLSEEFKRNLRDALWQKLSPIVRDFDIIGITPFPSQRFPVLPVIVPYWIKIRGRTGTFGGKIMEFADFSNLSGRFLLLEEFREFPVEKYLLLEKTGLDGRKIYRIFDSSFSELARDVMLSFFISSSSYMSRVGGCTITFLDTDSKYYVNRFEEFKRAVSSLNPIIHKKRFKVVLQYDEELNVSVSANLKIKYTSMRTRDAEKFYSLRRASSWEKSAMTKSETRKYSLINLADIPYIGRREEGITGDEFSEYSVDIVSYVIERHLTEKPLDENFVERHKEKFIMILDSEFPLLAEAMRLGIIVDISNINGFGEHLARLISSWQRIGLGERLQDFYISLLERVDDVLHDRLKIELSSVGEKRRIERIINRVLWELNTLKPGGWNYEYFEKKMMERGIEDRVEKIFNALLRDGVIIMPRKGIYRAVANL